MKLLNPNFFINARKTIKRILDSDPDLKLTYEANVAMLLYDKFGGVFKDYQVRNDTAKEILDLIFGD